MLARPITRAQYLFGRWLAFVGLLVTYVSRWSSPATPCGATSYYVQSSAFLAQTSAFGQFTGGIPFASNRPPTTALLVWVLGYLSAPVTTVARHDEHTI